MLACGNALLSSWSVLFGTRVGVGCWRLCGFGSAGFDFAT